MKDHRDNIKTKDSFYIANLIVLSIGIVLCLSGLFYITRKTVFGFEGQGHDFEVLWAAGRSWLKGFNPYDISVISTELKQISLAYDRPWAYPPSWSSVLMVFGAIPYPLAEKLWRGINYIALLGVIFLSSLWLKQQKLTTGFTDARLWLGASYCYFLQATPSVINLGQTTILSVFAVIMFLYGLSKRWLWLTAVGIYFLALKPQIGLILLISFFVSGYYKVIIIGAGVSFLSSLPAFITSGFFTTLNGFLGSLGDYSAGFESNQPQNITGLVHLFYYLTGAELSTKIVISLSLFVGIVTGILMRRSCINFQKQGSFNQTNELLTYMIFLLSVTAFLMPLHSYDFFLYAPIMIFALYLPWRYTVALLPGLLLGFRGGNLTAIIGISHPNSNVFPDSLLNSITATLLTISSLTILYHLQSKNLTKKEKIGN